MKKLIVILFAAVFAVSAEAAVRRLPALTVAEGENATIDAKGVVSLSSGNTSLAVVTPPDGGSAMVSGIRLGETDITYSDARGPYAVRPVIVVPTYWSMLQKFFQDDPEVNLGVVGDKVVISGQTANVDTLRKLDEARRLDPQRLVVQVNYAAEALGVLVTEYLDTLGVSNVSVKVMGRDVCLTGRMFDKQSIARVDTRVKEFLKDFPGVTVNSDGLRVYKQKILISIEFLSYDINRARNLGIKWPDSISAEFSGGFDYAWNTGGGSSDGGSSGGGGTTGGGTSSSSSSSGGGETRSSNAKVGVSGVKATINMMKQNRVARKLYSTQLSTQSGEPAVFQSGGTIHKVQDSGMSSTTTKEIEYGFIIKTTPVIIDPNTVNLDFELDHKTPINLSESNSRTDLNVERYQTKSKYVVRPGESIVLSGFNKNTEDVTRNGMPFLSKLPFIGKIFFGNTGRNANDVEMILVVTIDWSYEDETKHSQEMREKLMARPVDVEMP